MHFTREPIIETIITPKEGYKLILRKSKGSSQEEFIVDSVEIVSFGKSCFFRSLERPKSFLVPVEDYEVMEVRETRMVLKSSGVERGIKIGGGREVAMKASKEVVVEKEKEEQAPAEVEAVIEHHREQRRERRRHRKRREKEEQIEKVPEGGAEEEAEQQETPFRGEEQKALPAEARPVREKAAFSSLIPPPSTLISETISRYKDTQLFPRPISDAAREGQEKERDDEKEHIEPSDSEKVPSSEEKRSAENDRAD